MRSSDLPPDIAVLLDHGDGLITIDDAERTNLDTSRLRHLMASGRLLRLARGAYTGARHYNTLRPWQRHVLEARALVQSCNSEVFLTGWSAVAIWGLPTLRKPPPGPALVRLHPSAAVDGGRGGWIQQANVPRAHQMRYRRAHVVSPAWAVAEMSRHSPLEQALAAADAVARRAAEAAATTDPDSRRLRTLDLDDAVANMRHWSGVQRSRWVAQYADPCAETPIESLGRFACLQYALPMPVANAWVGERHPEYRVDGLWPWHWAAFEADGAVKYNLRPDASDIVAAQNEREWWLRRLGLDFTRFGWELAAHRRPTLGGRFRQLLSDNPPRKEPIQWWKHVPGLGAVEPEARDWPTPLNGMERIPRHLLPPRRRRYR